MSVAVTPRIAAQTVYQGVNPNEYLFPFMCRKQNGDYLMMARKAPGHQIPPGTIVARTSATGLAGSWSSEATVFTPPGGRNAAAGAPRLLADGRIAVQAWYDDSDTSPPYVSTTLVSTDATATAWVRGGDLPDVFGVGALGGNPTESPIVVMPDGSWLVASYSPEVATSNWSSVVFRSTDEGASWSFLSYIARASGGTAYEEPFLLLLHNGELIASVRVTEAGGGRYSYIYRSTNDGSSWTMENRITGAYQTASRIALGQTGGGTVIAHHRLLSGGSSGRGVYHFSTDNALTWSVGNELDSNTTPPTAAGPPVYSYGDVVPIAGGVAMIWADETPISGSGPAIQFRTFDVTGEPATVALTPATEVDEAQALSFGLRVSGLVLDPGGFWYQAGTSLTVHAAVGQRREATGVITSVTGGICSFRGANASIFEASLNGTDWASTVTIPAGDTPIWLGVTGSAVGTVTAEFGAPL